jgi:hypothetical protein
MRQQLIVLILLQVCLYYVIVFQLYFIPFNSDSDCFVRFMLMQAYGELRDGAVHAEIVVSL